MKRVAGLRGGGKALQGQEGAGEGLLGVVTLTDLSHGEGDPCARTWWALRK